MRYEPMKSYVINNLLTLFSTIVFTFLAFYYTGFDFNFKKVEAWAFPFCAGVFLGDLIMLIKSILYIRKIIPSCPKTEFSGLMDKELAADTLEFTRTTLLDLVKEAPENGRAFFLLAQISFYQGKYDEAKQFAEQAKNNHYKIPADFLNNLSIAITATAHSLK